MTIKTLPCLSQRRHDPKGLRIEVSGGTLELSREALGAVRKVYQDLYGSPNNVAK